MSGISSRQNIIAIFSISSQGKCYQPEANGGAVRIGIPDRVKESVSSDDLVAKRQKKWDDDRNSRF